MLRFASRSGLTLYSLETRFCYCYGPLSRSPGALSNYVCGKQPVLGPRREAGSAVVRPGAQFGPMAHSWPISMQQVRAELPRYLGRTGILSGNSAAPLAATSQWGQRFGAAAGLPPGALVDDWNRIGVIHDQCLNRGVYRGPVSSRYPLGCDRAEGLFRRKTDFAPHRLRCFEGRTGNPRPF